MKQIGICDITALEIYRSSRRLLPDLLDRPRTSKVSDCHIPRRVMLKDEMERLGAATEPYHLLVPSDERRHIRDDIVCHKICKPLPPRSLIRIKDDIVISSPELLFCELAARDDMDVIELALIGNELCGTYLLDDSWDGLTNIEKPPCSTEKIARIINHRKGARGIQKARRALQLIRDYSNSPMETVLFALFSFPRSLGGLGIDGAALNGRVATPLGSRRVDILFRRLRTGLEYKGRRYHSIQQASRDDRRQNSVVGSGIAILNVWYEDILHQHLFDQLVRSFERVSGTRIRIRDASFRQRQLLLRARLLPRIQYLDTFDPC